MTAAQLIADRQPFYVIHKTAFGGPLYLTGNATWTRDLEWAAAFEIDQDAHDFIGSIDARIVERSKVSPVKYYRSGSCGVD